ncbi:MAG: hypothetical protein ACLFPJ_04650 [Candidatus Woesearchaeota archaeon]
MVKKKQNQNETEIKLNPLFYPLEVVYNSSYALIEKAYFSFKGDPKKEIIVNIVAKDENDIKTISEKFNEQLINNLEYKTNYERNKDIRNIILHKILEVGNNEENINNQSTIKNHLNSNKENEIDEEFTHEVNPDFLDDDLFDLSDEELDEIEDPLGIAVPWDEKYSNKKNIDDKEKKTNDFDENDFELLDDELENDDDDKKLLEELEEIEKEYIKNEKNNN